MVSDSGRVETRGSEDGGMKKQRQIDPFSQRRLADIHAKFAAGQKTMEQTASFARIGFLTSQFDDLDLLALSRAGLLTFGDIAALVKLERLPKSEQPTF